MEPTGFGTPSDYTEFHVLENTPTVHHIIVCTLCSCYPRPLLGMSPEWYRSPNYRRRIVRWPRQVLAEFGLVLPLRPPGTEGWTEEQLAEIVTRDCMIGVALPRADRIADDPRPVQKARRPVRHRGSA